MVAGGIQLDTIEACLIITLGGVDKLLNLFLDLFGRLHAGDAQIRLQRCRAEIGRRAAGRHQVEHLSDDWGIEFVHGICDRLMRRNAVVRSKHQEPADRHSAFRIHGEHAVYDGQLIHRRQSVHGR